MAATVSKWSGHGTGLRIYVNSPELSRSGAKAYFTQSMVEGDDFPQLHVSNVYTTHGKQQAEKIAGEVADKYGRSWAKLLAACP